MKVFEGKGVGFGEGKGKLSPESFPFPSPIFSPPDPNNQEVFSMTQRYRLSLWNFKEESINRFYGTPLT